MSGKLFLIGGHEDRDGERVVLKEVARACVGGPLVLVTAPSNKPEEYLPIYTSAFQPLGVDVVELRLRDRAEADDPARLAMLHHAGGVFISGGGQGKGADVLLGSVAARNIRSRWDGGMTIAGTSAGAALLGEWMLGGGANDESPSDQLSVIRGLDFLPGTLVDQHLAQRGRTPRLVGAAALKGIVGIGVDEDTAAVVRGNSVDVIGAGTVTIVDTVDATAERTPGGVSVRDARVSLLTASDNTYELPRADAPR
jgi:cyanophycinase